MENSQISFATDALIREADAVEAARPDEPSLPPIEWMRKNLFSSAFNSLLTILFAAIALFAFKGLLDFIFSENTRWDAVRSNLRLLFTQAYPDENYTRVWVTVAIVLVLTGISLGLTKVGAGFSMKRISTWCFAWGGLIAAGTLLREPSVLKDENGLAKYIFPDGSPVARDGTVLVTRDADGNSLLAEGEEVSITRESFGDAMGDRIGWWILGLGLIVVGLIIWNVLGDLRRRTTFVPAIPFALAGIGLLISSTWWFGWGNYTFAEGEFTFEPGEKVASTTRIPWTIMFFILIGAYVVGKAVSKTNSAGRVRLANNAGWFLAPFVTFFAVLRAPIMDWGYVFSTDLPLWLLFAIGGAAVLWFLTQPGIGEKGRVIASLIVLAAVVTWLGGFFGWFAMLQKVRLSVLFLGLAGLLAPNFIGDTRQRMKIVYGWLGFITIFHILVTIVNTPSAIEVPTEDFAGGFMVTVYVAVFTMIFSFPLGVMLAMARTSRLPLFRLMATTYIEVVRGVPLITILFFFTVFINLFLPPGMELSVFAAVVVGFVLFSAAYMAENVRGGLQAIRRGQYEASDALGLTTVQRTAFIVLPQGLRVSIPPLVGQTIATFKETSLLAIVGVFDFLRMARDVVPNQPEFLGVQKPNLLFISVIYFIVSYAMSKYSQRLEKQLGVGER